VLRFRPIRRAGREVKRLGGLSILHVHRIALAWIVPWAQFGVVKIQHRYFRARDERDGVDSKHQKGLARGRRIVVMQSFMNLYVRELRECLKGDVFCLPIADKDEYAPRLKFRDVDVFHLHFLDAFGRDIVQTRRLIERLKSANVKIVWTAHDLTPHSKEHATYDPIFQLWAQASDGVIHHSAWGEAQFRQRYNFSSSCEHLIITHGWHQKRRNEALLKRRHSIEKSWGLSSRKIRIGLVGSPRQERNVGAFLDGVALSSNQEIEVVCWSLGPHDKVPDDPRIVVAETYQYVTDHTIAQRLAVCDLIALPMDPHGEMLTTGLSADALAMGCGILASEWEYLRETVSEASIVCGHTAQSVAACLDALDATSVERVKNASDALRPRYSWSQAREPVASLYERILERG
jgi:hypothetical protein